MTEVDTDGARLMVVWGLGGPPRYEDGSPVVTYRLRAKLTALELSLYSGDGLREHLARRVQYLTGGEPIDGRDPDDFVSYGLELAARYREVSRAAVSTWVRQEVVRARKREHAVGIDPLYPEGSDPVTDPEDPGHRPITLSEDWAVWIDDRFPGPVGRAIRLFAEGLTATEAIGTVGTSRQKFYQALSTLRKELE